MSTVEVCVEKAQARGCLVANRSKFGRRQILLLYGYTESVELLYPLPEREAPLTSCLSWGWKDNT